MQRGSGGYGYSWASTGGSIHGLSLHFDVMWLYSNYAYYRAYGLQLRYLSNKCAHRAFYWQPLPHMETETASFRVPSGPPRATAFGTRVE
ncbi:hypothetical protein [uncultured Rikenella sp.]|uniref:hypothetical protein n=1 Tax=uncultured Rikenella sp. TaxID=368003 RepID=UPI00261469C2|nr:hypothetical protein [uncultured Rikenella sp.]